MSAKLESVRKGQKITAEALNELVERVNAVCGPGRAELDSLPGANHGHPDYASAAYEERRFRFLGRVFGL